MIRVARSQKFQELLLRLPIKTRKKFANPKHPELVHENLGVTEFQLLFRGICYISRAIELAEMGRTDDGMCKDYRQWIGLTKKEMHFILEQMMDMGWGPGAEVF